MRDLNDMLIFAAVVEHGGFTAAALAYDLPKSNISRRVTRLEQSIGARLLERTTRKQNLTEVGKVFYAHCIRIQEEIESAELSVNTLQSSPRGIVKVTASTAVGQGLISPFLAEFKQRYPEVQLELKLTNRRVDLIEEGFDLAIRVGDLADSNLVAKRLCSKELHLYGSLEYLNRIGMDADLQNSPELLSNLDCLFMNEISNKAQWRFYRGKEECQVHFNPVFCCDDFGVLRQLVEDGAGIAVLPDYIGREAVDRNKLVRVLPQWLYKEVDIFALYPSHKGATPKLRALLDYLTEKFAASKKDD